jgi:hypothetical protein
MTNQIAKLTTDKNNDLSWVVRSETPTANKYFPARAWIRIDRNGIVAESVEAVGVCAPSGDLRDYALRQSKRMPTAASTYTAAHKKLYSLNRSGCLNCNLPVAWDGCKYCTDCYGEF